MAVSTRQPGTLHGCATGRAGHVLALLGAGRRQPSLANAPDVRCSPPPRSAGDRRGATPPPPPDIVDLADGGLLIDTPGIRGVGLCRGRRARAALAISPRSRSAAGSSTATTTPNPTAASPRRSPGEVGADRLEVWYTLVDELRDPRGRPGDTGPGVATPGQPGRPPPRSPAPLTRSDPRWWILDDKSATIFGTELSSERERGRWISDAAGGGGHRDAVRSPGEVPIRSTGPLTLIAAPPGCRGRTGADTDATPGSRSSTVCTHPSSPVSPARTRPPSPDPWADGADRHDRK